MMRKITSFKDKKGISLQNKIKKATPQYPDDFLIKKRHKIAFLHKNGYLCAP
jgi:hypothetical protein